MARPDRHLNTTLARPLLPGEQVMEVADGRRIEKWHVLLITNGDQGEFVWVDGTPLGPYVHIHRGVCHPLTTELAHPRETRVMIAGTAEAEQS